MRIEELSDDIWLLREVEVSALAQGHDQAEGANRAKSRSSPPSATRSERR